MTASILQETSVGGGSSFVTSLSLAFVSNATANSSFHVLARAIGPGSAQVSFTCSDNRNPVTNPYIQRGGTQYDGASGHSLAQFTIDKVAAGATTVTINISQSSNFTSIWIREIGGTDGFDIQASQYQNPFFGSNTTDSITTGTIAPNYTPGLISAFCNQPDGIVNVASGTGFTSDAGSGANNSEHLRYTDYAPLAATWTGSAATTAGFTNFAAFFKEAGALPNVGRKLQLVGPGKLRLPPLSTDYAIGSFTPVLASNPFFTGPGISPVTRLQFTTAPRSTDAKSVTINIAGILPINSTFYGALALATVPYAFIPIPGAPGPSPFHNLQFTSFPYATTQPSGTNLFFVGSQLLSNSIFYGTLSATGALSSLSLPSSLFFGNATALTIGTFSSGGTWGSDSGFVAAILGTGQLVGAAVSNSFVSASQIGAGFQPLIPMTATTDVRLKIGYQPWTAGKDDVIG